MTLLVRRVTLDDMRAMDAVLPPEWRIGEPIGYAAERDGELVAVGSVTWDQWGRAWGWFNRRGHVPAITMQRCALATLKLLRDVGEPRIYTICNAAIPGSDTWLRRLGFAVDPTLQHNLGIIWRCDLST